MKRKDLTEFYRQTQARDGRQSWCAECAREASRQYGRDHREERTAYTRARNLALKVPPRDPRYMRDWRLKVQFSMTYDEFAELLASQGGVCAICGEPETLISNKTGEVRSLSIDHDHSCCPDNRTCGECLRGLLCHSCNVGLGRFKDDPKRLRSAADYLERYASTT